MEGMLGKMPSLYGSDTWLGPEWQGRPKKAETGICAMVPPGDMIGRELGKRD